MKFLLVLIAAGLSLVSGRECHQYSEKIETPCNEVLAQSSKGYELRQYGQNKTFFTDAYVPTDCFWKAMKEGFDKNFKYISGANKRNETIPMTAPVTFRYDSSPMTGGWHVGFFVPSKYADRSMVPNPNDPSVSIVRVPENIVFAVKTFGGFAGSTDFKAKTFDLITALKEDGITVVDDELRLFWASYDSPITLFHRHNEVWVHVEAPKDYISVE